MDTGMRSLIIVNGKDRTDSVVSCKYVGSKCNIVYDITTETGHFLCNNILSHNCFAYSLKQLVEKGLYWIKTFNNQPPKHLCTFTDFVGEFISYNCNRTSGAKH